MDTHKIDLVGYNKEADTVYLIIMDDQNWDDPRGHIDLIHEKILSYVAFVENGSLKKKYPDVVTMNVIIKVIFEVSPTEEGQTFVEQVKDVLDGLGYQLEFVDYASI